MPRSPFPSALTFVAFAALPACATGSALDDDASSEATGATSDASGATASSGPGAGGVGAGGATGSSGPGGGHGSGGEGGASTSSSSSSSSSTGATSGTGGVGTSGSGGSGGGTTCTVFETSVMCMAGWTVVFVGTTGSQGGHFTWTSGDGCVTPITDLNCNPDSSLGTSCPLLATTLTVVHDPCDGSPPCSATFPIKCP